MPDDTQLYMVLFSHPLHSVAVKVRCLLTTGLGTDQGLGKVEAQKYIS